MSKSEMTPGRMLRSVGVGGLLAAAITFLLTMLLGALLLLLADTLGRSAFQPREIPVGIVISVLSAPYFLFLLRRYF